MSDDQDEDEVEGWCFEESCPYTLKELGDDAWLTGCPQCGASDCSNNLTDDQRASYEAYFGEPYKYGYGDLCQK